MRMCNRRELGGVALGALAAGCASAEPSPDLILHGGPIYTGVAATPRVEAVRIRNGRFAALGALSDVSARARGARLIDLAGAAAFPGFKDGHCHLGGVGMAAMVLDLVGVGSVAGLRERLRAYAATHRDGAIYGRGWIETHWPERRFPNRADLDDIVGDRPVFLERVDGHAAVVNGAALALAGVDSTTANPAGGSIERHADGRATGMLIDNAMGLVQSRLPAPTAAMQRQALAQALSLYAARGWTGATNMSTSLAEAMLLQEFAAAGEAPIHTDIYLTPEDSQILFRRGAFAVGNAHVRGVKLYMDGALGSRGAALLAPYADAHGDGLLVTPPDELRAFLARARAQNVQIATHAIGDRGNRLVLDAYRDVFGDDSGASRAARWRIEHAQVLAADDIPRFAALGIVASMQPSHAISDLHFAPSRLGRERLAGAYAWRSLLDSGAVIAGGSDAPVERGDPLIEFYAAAYRHDLAGFAGADWRLDQAVTRAEALRMLTWAPAYAAFAERERGTIEVGKRADVSVFSVDLMTAEPSAIPTAQARLTLVDGGIAHEAN